MNITVYAGCPNTVTIAITDGSPYRAGDELTCSSDGYPAATYAWTLDGKFYSTGNTQDLEEGEHVYVCTATVSFAGGQTCSGSDTRTVIAYSKYQKQYTYNTIVTILMLMALCVMLPSISL